MKHEVIQKREDCRIIFTYGEHGHGEYYITINHTDGTEYAWMALWYCNAETGDHPVATEFNVEKTEVELRRAAGRMMQRICEGGYHVAAIHLLADLVQDVA